MRKIIKEFIDKVFDFFENKQEQKEKELNDKFKRIEDLIKQSFKLSEENKILNIKITELLGKLDNLEIQKKQDENLINKQKEEIEILKKQKIGLENKNENNLSQIKNQQKEIYTLQEDNKNKDNQISFLEEENKKSEKKNGDNLTQIKNQQEQIDTLQKDNENKDNEIKELTPKVEELSQIDNYLNKDKKVLVSLLRVDSLEEFRKESGIHQDDYISLLNLSKLLVTKNVIIEKYYDKLLKYKKQNPEPMTDMEKEFYQSLNDYFNEEVIDLQNIEFTSFDRDKMSGLNGEYRGDIQNPKVIIPTHNSYNQKKAKILVKG